MSRLPVETAAVTGLRVVARDVHVSYADHEVLRGVDLRVEPGQLVAVTGPSGAGKTTLLWTLAWLVRPDRGEVLLGSDAGGDGGTGGGDHVGGTVPDRDRDESSELGVVLIPQDNALATVLTAAENVLVPLLGAGVRADEARARTAVALESVGLAGAGDQLVEELSGGQQQRVAVARGLAQRGTVVLADEPTSELDAVNRGRVVALLRAEADRGAAVVLATHDPDAADACDAELRLDDGTARWVRRP